MNFPGPFVPQVGFDPAEDHMGPFYYLPRTAPDWRGQYAFKVEPKHCNAMDSVHGGVLMTFADFALCMAATDHYETESCVTVSFSSEFLSGANIGDVVITEPQVHRKTGSLAFVSGVCLVNESPCFSYSSVVKRLKPRD
ncbi:MAG: PaaI family thioesterase [Gammaproteobacteria bacterium]|jgi:acyl-coenzyme A thioesterase PaaI-like protein|tara:strand:+ start:254 stop:670 length:417 start_codon:yes stop_codon:yes gene_type:complete